ncbi:unnamed protein product, partial [Prorocentrum cordatum]
GYARGWFMSAHVVTSSQRPELCEGRGAAAAGAPSFFLPGAPAVFRWGSLQYRVRRVGRGTTPTVTDEWNAASHPLTRRPLLQV